MNRRDFLRKAASLSAAAFSATIPEAKSQTQAVAELLPDPASSGIEHIVVVMQENRSFDHLLGWMPNANGKQAGLSYPDHNGKLQPTHRLTTLARCGAEDPDHSYAGGRSDYNHGSMNGWLRTGKNDTYAIGYYEEADLPLFSALARNYTTLNNYFASILSCTFPNRVFQHAAQTDRLNNTYTVSSLPTIWDRLLAAGVSCRYYYSNVPFLAIWGSKYKPISSLYPKFAEDVAAGNLPAVTFIDPRMTTGSGTSGNDDHPNADMRNGEIFLREIATTLMNSPNWANTVLVINRDEWGGFFDHVVPPRVIAPNTLDKDLVDGKALLGCRVPVLVISPFSRGNPAKPRINSLLYDHTSVLKMIEWRWGLQPLTARDASSEIANLALALDLENPDTSLPNLPVIPTPTTSPCSISTSAVDPDSGQTESGLLTADDSASDTASEAASPKQVIDGTDSEANDFLLLLQSDLVKGWPLPEEMQGL